MFDPREKIAVLIDGANLYSASRALGFDIDYRRLLSDFRQKGYLVRAIYYTALAEDQEYSSLRPLIDWLDYNGYRRRHQAAAGIHRRAGPPQGEGQHGHRARRRRHGDGRACRPFRALLRRRGLPPPGEALQRKGKKVTVASTLRTQPPMISDDLRRQADHFLELSTLADTLGPRSRAAAAAAYPGAAG